MTQRKLSLRAARLLTGMSQRTVAARLHISPASLRRWESGETIPNAAVFIQLCRLYGQHADAISLPDGAQEAQDVKEI